MEREAGMLLLRRLVLRRQRQRLVRLPTGRGYSRTATARRQLALQVRLPRLKHGAGGCGVHHCR